MAYELAPQPASLFHEGLMKKTSKAVLGQLLKSVAESQYQFQEQSIFVIDSSYHLRAVILPPNTTYRQVYQSYVSYIRKHFGLETIVVFDGYDSKNSTKVAEQQRRASKAVYRDILFDEDITIISFLANGSNKSRLIEMIHKEFAHEGMSSNQAKADADSLSATTALTLSKLQPMQVVVIGTDTDLLVIFLSETTSQMNLHMCRKNPPIVHDIQAIQKAIGGTQIHLMTLHAITGCDTVSALFSQGKLTTFQLADKEGLDFLNVFEHSESSKDDMAHAGKQFLLKLYGAHGIYILNKYRYTCYNRSISRSSLPTSFRLKQQPVQQQSHTPAELISIQQWKGHQLDPTQWVWHIQDNMVVPVETD